MTYIIILKLGFSKKSLNEIWLGISLFTISNNFQNDAKCTCATYLYEATFSALMII